MILRFFFIACLTLSACSDKNIDLEGPPEPGLRAWLSSNPTVRNSLKIEEDSNPSYFFGGVLSELSYDDWSSADKSALDQSFSRSWQWLYQSSATHILGTEEFSMPLQCTYCETRLGTHPNYGPFTIIPENLSKRAYISYVAHSLALELGGALNWSIASSDDSELHHYFNSRSMMHRMGGTTEFFFGEPGGGGNARIKYLGRSSPATPIFTYRWFVNNGLLKATHEDTILALLDWFRENGVHFYGSATYQNMNDHWGYPGQTSVYHVITGTQRVGETSPKHWTAGCHGTAGFIKSALKAVNIPVEVIYTCGHAQLYFPTIDRYMDHGDNPYNANVREAPEKSISNILVDGPTYASWFSGTPDYLDPADPLCDNIGKAALDF